MRTPKPSPDKLVDSNSDSATEMGDPDFSTLRGRMQGQGIPLPVGHKLAALVAHSIQRGRSKPKSRPANKHLVPQGLAAPIGRKGNMKP